MALVGTDGPKGSCRTSTIGGERGVRIGGVDRTPPICGEPVAGQLHAVTGVACEPDDDARLPPRRSVDRSDSREAITHTSSGERAGTRPGSRAQELMAQPRRPLGVGRLIASSSQDPGRPVRPRTRRVLLEMLMRICRDARYFGATRPSSGAGGAGGRWRVAPKIMRIMLSAGKTAEFLPHPSTRSGGGSQTSVRQPAPCHWRWTRSRGVRAT